MDILFLELLSQKILKIEILLDIFWQYMSQYHPMVTNMNFIIIVIIIIDLNNHTGKNGLLFYFALL